MPRTACFEPELASLGAARRFVRDAADDLGLVDSDTDAIATVATQLVRHAIEAENSRFHIELLPLVDSVRVEISRPSLTPEAASSELRGEGTGDRVRGIRLIEALSRSWGTTAVEGGGAIIWVDVPRVTGRRGAPH